MSCFIHKAKDFVFFTGQFCKIIYRYSNMTTQEIDELIRDRIKDNNTEDITGDILQGVLCNMNSKLIDTSDVTQTLMDLITAREELQIASNAEIDRIFEQI